MDKQTEIMILTGLSSLSDAVAALLTMQPNDVLSGGKSKHELIASIQKSASNLSILAQEVRDKSQAEIARRAAFAACSCELLGFGINPNCPVHGDVK